MDEDVNLLLPYLQDDGSIVAWHSGNAPLDLRTLRPFLHVGTRRQAESRTGRVLSRLVLKEAGCRRMRDMAEQNWSPARLRRLAASGCGYGVYLNRHEGVDLDEVERGRHDPRTRRAGGSIDRVPDRLFRRLVRSAEDSLIVSRPDLVIRIDAFDGKRRNGAAEGCA